MANIVKKAKVAKSVKEKTRVFSTEGTVRYALGATINKGNYESARVDIGITIPFDANTPGHQEHAFEEARAWAEKKMRIELQHLGKDTL